MDEFIGMGFESLSCFRAKLFFACAAPFAATVDEGVRNVAEADIALDGLETTRRVTTVGVFRAVERATRDEGGELGRRNAEDLPMENVVDACLQIGNLLRESRNEPFRDFAQEDAALAADVEKSRRGIPKQFRWQQIEHLVHDSRRRKNLIIREVRQAAQHIGIVRVIHRRSSNSR